MFKFDGGWVKILEQKAWVFFSLTLFFSVTFYLGQSGYIASIKEYPWAIDVTLLLGVLFGCLSIGSVLSWFVDWITNALKRRKNSNAALAQLDSLSQIEHNILSYLVQSNQRSFNTRLDNGDVVLLIQKGLAERSGGHQNIMEIAHYIPDHVWNELKKRRSEFASANMKESPPWHRDWMTY